MHANVHRGVHTLSASAATDAFEAARERVRRFLNARSTREIVFIRGTTESINLVAQSFVRRAGAAGRRDPDHAPRAPRQHRALADGLRRDRRRAQGRADRPSRRGRPRRARRRSSAERTRLVAIAHVSNALGTVLPVRQIVALAHARGVPVLLDGAQAVPHFARRRAGARLRLLRVLRPQALRPDRHRRAVRARGAARVDAAVAGRRRHDPVGQLRRAPPTTSCRTSSRRARRTSRARSASPRPSTTSTASASGASPPGSRSCSRTRPRGSPRSTA